MPVNASPEYYSAEKKYLGAQTLDEKIFFLEEMIKKAPKHKSSEKFVSELKQRLRKFQDKKEKADKRKRGSGKRGIRKEGFQIALLGPANSGKSSLLAKLTNAKPRISSYPFTTSYPEVGTLNYQGVKAQIVDLPSAGSENLDLSVIHSADLLLLTVENLDSLKELEPYLERSTGRSIIVITKSDLLTSEEKRKLQERAKSKKLYFELISTLTSENLENLKEKILKEMHVVRVYTKEPRKEPSKDPIALPQNSTVRDAAEQIRHGFSLKVKESRVTGPSSKFPNQKVGLSHVLKDLDIVEFHTK